MLSVLLLLLAAPAQGDYPFRNTSLAWEERVDDLVSRLSLEEITLQLSKGGGGAKGGPAPAIPRLGIKPFQWLAECMGGDARAGEATSFPEFIGMAASFSTDLIYRVSEATSVEVRAKYNNFSQHGEYGDNRGVNCLSPVINTAHDPRWGRIQESYGEDPVLSGALAKSFVGGMQGGDARYIRAGSCCMFLSAYSGPENIPISKVKFSAVVSDRDWYTSYLPAFYQCGQAGAHSMMCSYNSVNGIPACANKKLLTDILRTKWGFKGFVISDEAAIEVIISAHHYLNNSVDTAAACVNAGCNLEISADIDKPVFFSIVDAVKQGKLTESLVRDRVKPLFYTRMKLGEFDPPSMNPYSRLNVSVVQSEAHRNLSVEAAMKTFVLLKNKDKTLPLKNAKGYQRVAVIGPMANNPSQLYGDYVADMDARYTVTPLQGLSALWPLRRYAAGCSNTTCLDYNPGEIITAVNGSQLVFVCLGTGRDVETEGHDRNDLELPGHQLQLLKDAINMAMLDPTSRIILLLFNAGPLNITWAARSENVHTIMELFFPAQATGEALRRVVTAEGPNSVPAGRLPLSWPKYISDVPPITNYSMSNRTYRYSQAETLYPFGYGLSYTSFLYTQLTLTPRVKAGEDATGFVSVRNTGKYDAEEVIQIYISWLTPSVAVPNLQLVNFYRVFIPANAMHSYNFTIPAHTMAVWLNERQGWQIQPGDIVFWVGGQQPYSQPRVGSNVIEGQLDIYGEPVHIQK